MANKIKFNKFNVTNGTIKARVWYSLNNHNSGKPCVTIYSKDYGRELGQLIPEGYKNDTDAMTDYFDKGCVRLFEGHQHYAAAKARAEQNNRDREAQAAARSARSIQQLQRNASGGMSYTD